MTVCMYLVPTGKRLFTYRVYSPVLEVFTINLNYKGEKELLIASTDVDAITYQELKEIQIPVSQTNQQEREDTLRRANAIFNTGKSLYDIKEYQGAIGYVQRSKNFVPICILHRRH